MPDTPLNQDALEAVAHERYEARRSFEGLPPWEDLLERNRKAEIRALENTVSAYLAVAQLELQANSKPNQNLELIEQVQEAIDQPL